MNTQLRERGCKVQWTERYNCHSCRIGDFLVSVSWSTDREKPGYVVRFNDIVLKKNIAEIDKAKAAALKLARTVLTRSLAALGDA